MALAFSVVLAIFSFMLIVSFHKPLYISPLGTLGVQSMRSMDDTNLSQLENLLVQKKIAYSKISQASDSAYIIQLDTGEEIVVTFKKDINEQISSLQFILSRLTMEGKQFVRLDLRFDKPVIVSK